MYIVLLFALLSVGLAKLSDDPAWEEYKSRYGKAYTGEEEKTRYETWRQNVEKIERHNSEYSKTYTQGINQFTDMTEKEFQVKMCSCLKIPEGVLNGTVRGEPFVPPPSNVVLPDYVNWVEKGYVTPIKNQGQCGSCYSFSATGALEGAWFRKTGKLPSLSEQQIVDCSRDYGNMGCGGGWYQDSWRYIHHTGGSQSEASYPYENRAARCRFNRRYVVAQVTGYTDTKHGDENELKAAVAKGPVSVAINVSGGFGSYKHGVYYQRGCRNDLWGLNHAVLVVGYGTENGRDYWLVKNSWGTWFGLKGYIKMARNWGNMCGIATKPSYPHV